MLQIYLSLVEIAENEFGDIVVFNRLLGGKTSNPNKLRLYIKDGTFLDIWLSKEGDYSYHWEQRSKRGLINRWDNAPDHKHLETFPHHFHAGNDETVTESRIEKEPKNAIKTVLTFIRERLIAIND
ncbi:toxin-antitoxin system TumE family protein [Methanobacterium petrolearium]|uniref:toxin-antitoxin system TumE family protein n=1 Tax=Methanobacterium petrolearium TaxID=710190 RepID=UPI001AEA6857|nr:DUF6516 family protein [Methanobacterium petrolearium]MBP1946310.1 hypothetical protein [Methanobacterium petrolearium]BDZ71409.1 hypothetical protein GCM10025861_19260 [Methanobacterium petrolearium]